MTSASSYALGITAFINKGGRIVAVTHLQDGTLAIAVQDAENNVSICHMKQPINDTYSVENCYKVD